MSPTRLSSTKLEPPRLRPDDIERPALTARLDDASRERRVTLVVAPAGYGKTTAVAQWLSLRDAPPAAWLTLDRLDDDLDRFCRYVITALRPFVPGGLGRTEALLQGQTLPEIERLAETLANELEELEQSAVLVLDDYQNLRDEAVHGLVQRWIERLPRKLRLVVLTRRDPPWPIGLWRSRSWLAELRARDLAFTLPEVEAMVATQPSPGLSHEAIASLHRKTEGWAAGLRLALLSLMDASDPEGRIRALSGSERLIVDYLMGEIVATLDADVRNFLAMTAPMTRFCAPLCDALMADQNLRGNSQQLLDRLYRANLFLSPIGDRGPWYRYHQLFRQLLLDRFTELAPSLSYEAVTHRAGEWFLAEGWIEDGLQLLLAAGDLDGAADEVGRHLHEVVEQDLSRRTLTRWLELFPPGAERGRLPLIVASSYLSMLRGDTPSMRRLLVEAEQGDRSVEGEGEQSWRETLQVDLDNLEAFVHFWEGDPKAALEHATAALEAGSEGSFLYPAIIYRAAGLALTGHENEYEAFIQEGIFQAEASGSPSLGVYLITKAGIELHRGQLSRCRETADQGLAACERAVIPRFFEGHLQTYLGLVAYERDLLLEAEARFRAVEQRKIETARPFYHDALLGLAQVGLARSDLESADDYTARARAVATECGDPPALRSSAWFGQQLALIGGRETAVPIDPPTAADFVLLPASVPSECFAWLNLQRRSEAGARAALEVIDRASSLASRHGVQRRLLRLDALRALALHDLGERQEALSVLESAVLRATREGPVRPFVDCGDRMRELLAALPGSAESAFLDSLFAAFDRSECRAAPAALADSSPASWQVLTNRELDVLELLAERLTNKEIAAELGVTAETVKSHTLSLYRKLEVHGRRQAAAVAAERGLLRRPRD